MKELRIKKLLSFLSLFALAVLSASAFAAPESNGLVFWNKSDESNTASINHDLWQGILRRYVVDNHDSGVNRFDYKRVDKSSKKQLDQYLEDLKVIDPRAFSRAEQKAYWINMYNALTVRLILQHYPVKSITDLGESFFAFGPWDDEIIQLHGQTLSLNHIEHGILRPFFDDNRIHYAVNCASIGCPNLSSTAFTGTNTHQLLEQAASDYVNHPRGVHFDGEDLVVSSIYEWYKVDFGDSQAGLIAHLLQYAKPNLAKKLKAFQGDLTDDYDWNLNQP